MVSAIERSSSDNDEDIDVLVKGMILRSTFRSAWHLYDMSFSKAMLEKTKENRNVNMLLQCHISWRRYWTVD